MTGSGTLADPYIIWDVTDLQAMQLDRAAYYELGQDIDASATSGWNGGEGFVPISLGFSGQLDGKGYTVTGLVINRPGTFNQALFYSISTTGVVKNVNLASCSITGKTCAPMAITSLAGALIEDCSATGTITGNSWAAGFILTGYGTVQDCHTDCSVSVSDASGRAGGFVYANYGTIRRCYATGNVTGTGANRRVAGFVQSNNSTIQNCYCRGSASGGLGAGGFAYSNSDTITNCFSTGAPSGTSVGGFCMVNYDSITNCFWDTETSGEATSDGGTGKTTTQMKTESTFTDAGWDFTTPIWYIGATFNNGYPAFEGVLIPTVVTNPATSVVTTIATPNGTLDDDGGEACDCGFEWGLTAAYGNTTPTQSRTTGQTFSQAITGLSPNTTYHFRAFATNSVGTGSGADRTFTTQEVLISSRAHALSREEL